MRTVTRDLAFGGAWTDRHRRDVGALFDQLAPEWNDRAAANELDALGDALARGGIRHGGLWLDVGSGTGRATPLVAGVAGTVVALDLALEMLRLAPATWPRVRADAGRLPVADAAAAGLVLVNCFLFPDEAARVLAPGGSLVWVNSLGEATPIHLSADDVAAATGWDGVASEAGWGTWVVLRRP